MSIFNKILQSTVVNRDVYIIVELLDTAPL